MDQLLPQLGNLFLGSVPTILLFLVLVLAYQFLLYAPLNRVLGERRERTLGAIEKADASIAAADAKAQEYEARLRAARAEVLKAREARLQQWNAERETALNAARDLAHRQIHQARTKIDAEAAEARKQIEANVEQLAAQIIKTILPVETAR
jgi:F-type H+-transporting ATPase subunit b